MNACMNAMNVKMNTKNTYEEHDEHQEHIFEKFLMQKKTCKTPNLEFFNAYALRIQECI